MMKILEVCSMATEKFRMQDKKRKGEGEGEGREERERQREIDSHQA